MTKNNLVFGGVNSADYGVWISGSEAYGAPERNVSVISVPGRNGDLIIDNGKWNNIRITYPAFIPNGFNPQFDYFRSEIMKLKGYHRLEDSYHPDEYRMASLVGGITPKNVGAFFRNGDFQMTFNCKPQRFLKSGEDVSLSVTATGSAQYLVAEGKGSDIFSAEFKSYNTMNYDISYTIISLGAISDLRNTIVKLWYSDDILGTYERLGHSTPNPTTGWSSGTLLSHYWDSAYYEYDLETSGSGSSQYAFFPTPLRWELWNNGNLIDAKFPDSGSIFNPTGYEAKPLIHIKMSSEIDNVMVALINRFPIYIKSPDDNVLPGTGDKEMTDVYIDCETQNAYMPIGDAKVNLNPYVVLPRLPISFGEGESEVYINDSIDGIEIIPRWWRL